MADAIVVEGVSKRFRRYHPHRPFTLQEVFQRGLGRMMPVDYFWGLDDVSFSVEAGRTMGVIGSNGAGKSTLLRLIGGVGVPDKGRVLLEGKLGALLDLGAGFHADLTGRENVLISGVIGGLSYSEVGNRFDTIVAFAELSDFIDNPLRTYSTGMQMRLAFAVASHIDAEILLIDEVLAVGDTVFQTKCFDRIVSLGASGSTTVVVSHNLETIHKICDEVLWLRDGRLVAQGSPGTVIEQYLSRNHSESS